MVKIALIRPGSTVFDEQGRIKGCLDIPLSEDGEKQARDVAREISTYLINTSNKQPLSAVYCGPCQSAQSTAAIVAEACKVKVRVVDCMMNVDHGLWQGKLIDEVRRLQPRVYRQIQEDPETFSPPGGETIEEAQTRIRKSVAKLVKKHRDDFFALVAPEPLASLIRNMLIPSELGDLWKAEQDHGAWELISVESNRLAMV